eukprot:Protomagalhaensia_sp_Gyna_25__3190@NODE_290_length_4034_cov_181_182979_g224_i0_p3_GENE_NODE_290_length_4034_cov_181_182979_g224_i0NODE_290_length_4034_cov_181_182979_g224_i0_p3_ORF_typecomplete_len243_score42_90GspL_C/PF12693_7/0_38CHASE3/PF05227_13/0_97PspB/PF06667_12/0_79PspB/PF06667_12/2_3e03_NODE_290_length_4034_cov_181_182979_g224_i015472275
MGGMCVKSKTQEPTVPPAARPGSPPSSSGASPRSANRRSVRIAVDDHDSSSSTSSHSSSSLAGRARHSRSAPNIFKPASGSRKVKHSTTTYSVGVDKEVEEHEFHEMLRQFTRKSISGELLGGSASTGLPNKGAVTHAYSARRGPRRESRIDDKDVLKLIATKTKNPAEQQQLKRLEQQSLEEAKQVAPQLVERIQRRRQTMEKLDIFSPDAAPERLEELYEATEKLLAHEDATQQNAVSGA